MFEWLKRKTARPSPIRAEDFLEDFNCLKAACEDDAKTLGAAVTAIARIERKQNRWLEILNLKNVDLEKVEEAAKEPGDGSPLPPEAAATTLSAGQETEE